MKRKKLKPVKNQASPSTTSSPHFKVLLTDAFIAEANALKKKYPNIKQDFIGLKDKLKSNPLELGEPLGRDLYKIRMAITDKNAGKSGCARVIVQILVEDKVVYVLSVYDKGDKTTLTDNELKKILKRKLG